VQSIFRPWLFQAPAGSYQFAVRVQEPEQTELFVDAKPQVEQVASTFLEIVRASATDPEQALVEIVPDADYRETFLKLTRNLAPTGKIFERLDIRDASRPGTRPISLVPATRDIVNQAIRRQRQPERAQPAGTEQRLTGILRAVHLDQDWLEIAIEWPDGPHITIREVGETVDDVIGPMVNRRVIVDVYVTGGRYLLRDIQPKED
jgi:hypothetical protein